MCEVCKTHGINPLFANGNKSTMIKNHLYKVFKNSSPVITLCYIHSIELFSLGERRFLLNHINFARKLTQKNKVASDNDNFDL
jgi:hypothetical protein